MCGPMRGAVVGAVLLEGWRRPPRRPSGWPRRRNRASPRATTTTPSGRWPGSSRASMPLIVVREPGDREPGLLEPQRGAGQACCATARYGDDVLARLRWMNERLGPALRAGAARRSAADRSQADHRARRSRWATSATAATSRRAPLFTARSRRRLRAACRPRRRRGARLPAPERLLLPELLDGRGQAGHDGRARDRGLHGGHDDGAQRRRLRHPRERPRRRWFTAPAGHARGPLLRGLRARGREPRHRRQRDHRDLGLGGFALAAAPAIVGFVGGHGRRDAGPARTWRRSRSAAHTRIPLPSLGFAGSPAGIDVCRVVDTGLEPVINTGIAHREPGIGQIGAGLTRAPMACFTAALDAFAEPLAPAA